jgi:hypothetical protein
MTMNNKINPDVDIVNDILKAVLEVQPGSVFVNSLYHQYRERGGLSKKQLEGLHSKASKIQTINPGKLATLEAIIKKKPTRYKSVLPTVTNSVFEKDKVIGEILDAILAKYPQHKSVLSLKIKYNSNTILSALEIAEIQKFKKLLL